jgi:hypothetical protein
MARGVQRWSTGSGDETTWWARVWLGPEEYVVADKSEYEKKRYEPPFWQVNLLPRSFSKVVAAGMLRLCGDFTTRVAPLGFSKTKRRFWARENEHTVDSIYFHRGGSSYGGAPRSASISIRVMLGIHVLNHPSPGATVGLMSDNIRKPDGSAYHDRFNSETGSAYDLCLDDLTLFVTQFAEPWFAKWQEPEALLDYPDLPARTRPLLEQAVQGQVNPDYVAFSLKRCGIKKSRFARRARST